MSDQQQASGGGDELDGLTGFLFYMFIVHPATAWILRPGRFERKKSIMYAIGFLALLASVKTGMSMNARGPNHYQRLGVTRDSNPLEIKRAYKKLSLILHPDKNPSPNASDEFDALKQSYDVIIDMELREVYNKFGDEGIRKNKRYDESALFMELGVFYVTWGLLSYILTLGKKNSESRQWVLTGLIVMMVVEIAIMTTTNGSIIPKGWLPTWTDFEIVWLLHTLFPAFMNGCRSIGAYLYVDLDAQARGLLLALQEQNKDILLVLRDVQICTQSIQAHGGGGGGAVTTTSNAPVVGAGVGAMRATPTGKIKELQERLQASNTNVTQAVKNLKADSDSKSSLGFYTMIGGYILLSYFFNKSWKKRRPYDESHLFTFCDGGL